MKKYYDTNVIVTLHGEMDFIYQYKNSIEKFNGWIHKQIFKSKAPNFFYLVLNKIAKKKLVSDGYLNENEIIEINHPFSTLTLPVTKQYEFNLSIPIFFGHIGSMEIEHKNSPAFYYLAQKFNNEIVEKKAVFRAIGLITPEMLPFKNQWVDEVVGNTKPDKPDYLSRIEYENNVNKLDFSLFFYPENQYVFRASGAVIDAIAFETPIIVLNHPFFTNLFSQVGPIGYICNDIDEIEAVLKKIINREINIIKDYKNFKENIKLLREKFGVVSITEDISKQLKLKNAFFKTKKKNVDTIIF